MRLRLIRHATLQIELAGLHLLVDPMLAEPGHYRSLTIGSTAHPNPMVALPCAMQDLLHPDIIVVTHSHFDHFDATAAIHLPKEIPLICQPCDQTRFQQSGFTHVMPVDSTPVEIGPLQFQRTGGTHGKGLMGRAMGQVSGFLIKTEHNPLLYIAGDTIYNSTIETVLSQYQPGVIVLNSGAAQFNIGAPITMTTEDVVKVCHAAPQAQVIVVHLEAINHCRLTRRELKGDLISAGVINQVCIPNDGDAA